MRRLPLIAALLLTGCSAPIPGSGGTATAGQPTGLVIVTTGGTALIDGEDDVPPTLDLGVSGSGLTPQGTGATLDGRPLSLRLDGDSLRASVPAMAYGSKHHLTLSIPGWPVQEITFSVVDRTGVSAAAWLDAGAPLVDVVFERAPSQAPVAAALPGAALTWRDATHLRVRWTGAAPAALHLPAGIATDRGSVTEGPLDLSLGGLPGDGLRRVTVPAVTMPPGLRLTAFAIGTAASHESARAHAGALAALAPSGWVAQSDGSLAGGPDGADLAAAAAAGVPAWPLVANSSGDPDGTARLLESPAAVSRLVAAITTGAREAGAAGIHLDFEGVPGGDQAQLTALVTALATSLHRTGLRLAVDVVPHRPGGVNSASAAYDLPAIGAQADLVLLMTYDESISDPGPIAGLDWQGEQLAGSLPGLTPGHVLLGIPLYARRWAGGDVSATSYTRAVASALADSSPVYDYDFPAATPMLRSTDSSGAAVQTWFDDADSLARKLAVVPRLGLAGAAAWRLGFEDPALWPALSGA